MTGEAYLGHTPQRGTIEANAAGDILMADQGFKGFVIGATGSGTGKTTLTLAVLSRLKQMGMNVAPFKVGPDFIDPGHHRAVSGRISYNLDSWMLSCDYNRRLFTAKLKGADMAVVEGVMGLFDGYDGRSESGSTAQMAKWLDLPVLLVINAGGMARSAAAIVKGFETFDPDLKLAGVVFTKTGSPRHYQYLKAAVEDNCNTPCLGYMPRNEKIIMPERHLGLVTAEEAAVTDATLAELTSMVADHIDLERLIDSLPMIEPTPDPSDSAVRQPVVSGNRPRIAVARDKAFCFYYMDNLEMLEQAGAEIISFSPLESDGLPEDIDGIYFGGGYPEVHAQRLSSKSNLMHQIRELSRAGMPIYGECGGFMMLCRQLSGMSGGTALDMAGCFDFSVSMSTRLRSLGYREITLKADTIIGRKGDVLRGHEFHYSSIENQGDNPDALPENIYQVSSRAGQDIDLIGCQRDHTLGSYLHLHFGSNPSCAARLVEVCAAFRQKKKSCHDR